MVLRDLRCFCRLGSRLGSIIGRLGRFLWCIGTIRGFGSFARFGDLKRIGLSILPQSPGLLDGTRTKLTNTSASPSLHIGTFYAHLHIAGLYVFVKYPDSRPG